MKLVAKKLRIVFPATLKIEPSNKQIEDWLIQELTNDETMKQDNPLLYITMEDCFIEAESITIDGVEMDLKK